MAFARETAFSLLVRAAVLLGTIFLNDFIEISSVGVKCTEVFRRQKLLGTRHDGQQLFVFALYQLVQKLIRFDDLHRIGKFVQRLVMDLLQRFEFFL
ncbi:hypothetical protein IIA29_12510 [candidate division KSB1 bacterium]|nr:hypothetical protein [candidate division KSB1 bacterium]